MDPSKSKLSNSKKTPNNSNKVSLSSDKAYLSIHTLYKVGQGGLWGNYDFWMGVLESLTASAIFSLLPAALRALSKTIMETLKSSKASKDDFESCRFDIFIPAKGKSWVLLRVMQSVKFRTEETIEEDDIYNALAFVVSKFNDTSKKYPRKKVVVIGELFNSGNETKLVITKEISLKSVHSAFDQQIRDAQTANPTRINF
jgi:hypothetical protein